MIKRIFVFLMKTTLVFIVIAVFVAFFGYNVLNHLYFGPSVAARNLFVSSVMETMAGRFLATWFFSDDKITQILTGEGIYDFGEDDEVDLSQEVTAPIEVFVEIPEGTKENIELIDIRGSTFRGKLLKISDPSRVSVTTSYPFHEDGKGMKLLEMTKATGAVAGINGGSFTNNSGDVPVGIAISSGKILHGGPGIDYNVIGFTEDNVLIVGRMSYEKIIENKIRDAVSFSPFLIINGTPQNLSRLSKGLNPRTVIGQCADGTVLFLVIDGRQPHSLGANYQDLIDIMLEYGAVNAAVLDGGSSSLMVLEDEIITNCCSLYGPGRIPTAFIVN